MKTPREILLAKHQTAETKLDEARRSALAQLKSEAFGLRCEAARHAAIGTGPDVPKAVSPLRFATAVQIIWRELVLPKPQAWATVGAAWILIFALKISTHDAGPAVAKNKTLSPQVVAELKQQKAFFGELAGLPQLPNVNPPKAVPPRPRSAHQPEFSCA